MDEFAIVLIVVVPVVASAFLYVYTSNSTTMSICYGGEQKDHDIEFALDADIKVKHKPPVIATF